MNRVPLLQTGDVVRIISTARKIDPAVVEEAKYVLESWGLKVTYGKHLFSVENQYAGSDAERIYDLQEALDDEGVKAVFCARGGYGTLRIIDAIDFSSFMQSPKWVIGYSDITVLHAHLLQVLKTESLHASMPINFHSNTKKSLDNLRKALMGSLMEYHFVAHEMNISGSSEGILTGGNLSILYALKGSVSFPDLQGKILFLEDLDEYLYHLDRMMISLKRSGAFTGLRGLVVGGLTNMHDNEVPFGMTAEEILRDAVKDLDVPVCFGFPAGHIDDNNPLILGRTVRLVSDPKGCLLKFNS